MPFEEPDWLAAHLADRLGVAFVRDPRSIFLFGPSGCGKTTLGGHAATVLPFVEFHDLDHLVQTLTEVPAGQYLREEGNDAFLAACIEAADRFVSPSPGTLTLVAVGAGALQSERALDWVRGTTSVCLYAPASVNFPRNPLGPGRSFSEYEATEYSHCRQEIYRSARYFLDLDSRLLEAAQGPTLLTGAVLWRATK